MVTGSGNATSVPSGNILNFFEDDSYSSQDEAFAGSVDWIRIHNDSSTFGVIPEPTTLAMIGLGAVVIAFTARRRRENQIA